MNEMSSSQKPNIEHNVFYLLKELTKVLRIFQKDEVFCENITFTQFCILDFVIKDNPLELSILHSLLSVEKSTTTRLVEPLVKEGLLEKIRSSRDSRAIQLRILEKGVTIHTEVWKCISGFILNVTGQIPDEKKGAVMDTLELFINAFKTCC